MSRVLAPVDLGARTARNRIVFGPHETNLARRRSVSDRHVAYYRRRAAGGAGIVVVESASVHPSDWPYERCPLAAESVEGWAAVAEACTAEGALVLAALGHSGGQGSSAFSQAPMWAPSRVPEVNTREVPKEMEEEEIAAVVAGFVSAARLAGDAGLHGVEVGAGQHSLLRQFLSGLTNQRGDRWGEDRALLLRTVLTEVRAAAPDLVLTLRLSCDELAPWAGIVPDVGARLAADLAPIVDAVTVVRGSIFTVSATRPDGHVEPGFNAALCAQVRAAVVAAASTPVVAQGSVVDPAMAEELIETGACDLVEMTRALIADPDLAVKLTRGEPDRVRPCILCNQACQVRDNRNPIVSCVAEPSAGHETQDMAIPAHPHAPADGSGTSGSGDARAPLHVLVVGGGPAGLECARVAALSGHRVRLAERCDHLGGALRSAASAAGRHRLSALVDWLETECRHLGVDIATGIDVGPAGVDAHDGPVVLCTGSLPGRQTYTVAAGASVVPAAEILARHAHRRLADTGLADTGLADGPVAVWDPIGGPIGISVAEELRTVAGCDVTLLSPDLVVGDKLSLTGDLAPANVRLQAAGVVLRKRALLRRVEPGHVVVEDRFTGEQSTVAAAVLIDAGHRLPDDHLWQATGQRLARAGDAVAPRTVLEAVLEGRRAAQALANTAVGHRSRHPGVMRPA